MEKTFDGQLISDIVHVDDSIFNIVNLSNYTEYKRLARFKMYLAFVNQVGETLNLDVDDATFRKIIGTFYTDMVNNVMEE